MGSSVEQLLVECIPLIDFRLLSQSEILSLSLSSSSSRSASVPEDDLHTPKIDRSVFNESAGSRKQTYSRLRLAPRNHRPSPPNPAPQHRSSIPLSLQRENSQILPLLRSLFSLPEQNYNVTEQRTEGSDLFPVPVNYNNTNITSVEPIQNIPVGIVDYTKRKRGRPRKNDLLPKNDVTEAKDGDTKALPVMQDDTKDIVIVEKDGKTIDLIALADMADPFGEELRKRTQGMETADELLGFLRGLKGEWMSKKEKRKVVDAADIGDVFPRGWMLMLYVKKRAGRVSLACRRYISPNGRQFATCKEVSLFLRPFYESQIANQTNSSLGNASGEVFGERE